MYSLNCPITRAFTLRGCAREEGERNDRGVWGRVKECDRCERVLPVANMTLQWRGVAPVGRAGAKLLTEADGLEGGGGGGKQQLGVGTYILLDWRLDDEHLHRSFHWFIQLYSKADVLYIRGVVYRLHSLNFLTITT